jgi:hypothetical protein
MSEKIEPHNRALVEDKVIDGFVVDERKNILRAGIPQSEARQMYVEGLLEKAQRATISREEALIILQGILADMLNTSIPEIEKDANSGEPGPAQTNARLLVEIAKETRDEMLKIVDHSMEKRQFVRRVLHIPGFKR